MNSTAISAHRGAVTGRDSTDLAMYAACAELGVDYIELDIRRTCDGELVVFHDERVSISGPLVRELNHTQLIDLLGHEVLKLADVLHLFKGRVGAHLDLKDVGYEAQAISLAIGIIGEENIFISTLEDDSVRAIRREFPKVMTALTLGRSMRGKPLLQTLRIRLSEVFSQRQISKSGAQMVAVHFRIARLTALRQCGRKGIGVAVWTVDTKRELERYISDPRVNVVITNFPERAIAVRASAE